MRPDEGPDRSASPSRRPRIAGTPESLADDLLPQSPSSFSSTQPNLFTDDDGDVSMTSADDEDHGGANLDPDFATTHDYHHPSCSSLPPSTPACEALGPDQAEDPDLDDAGAPLASFPGPGDNWLPGAAAEVDQHLLSTPLEVDHLNDEDDEDDDDDEYDAIMPNPLPPPFFEPQGAEVIAIPAASDAPPSGGDLAPVVLYQPPPTLTPGDAAEHLQALESVDDDADAPVLPFQHLAPFLHPDASIIGGANQNLADFLFTWYRQSRPLGGRLSYRPPWPNKANEQISSTISHVQYAELDGDCCDFQGLNWEDMGVTRKEARDRRSKTYHNYTNEDNADQFKPSDRWLPSSESFFRFRRMDIKRDILVMHFQLRNILATTSRAEAFYTADHAVLRFDPVSGITKTIMRVPYTQVSTIAAKHGVLMAGCFNGEYVLRSIDSEADSPRCEVGTITSHNSGITNHIQIYQPRTGTSPLAAIASNDKGVRTLDLGTQTWLSTVKFEKPVNCTAVSPDRRLRVVVGDDPSVYVIPTDSTLPDEKPEILYKLDAHRDCAFACDWADDGWTVATGCQDRTVKIWDARKWTNSSGAANPVTSICSELACVRSLHFSPAGSGKRVLAAVEEADFVSVIDAQTFSSKQRFDVIGELGGAGFTEDGQDLHVLCTDFPRGGIIQLERCGLGRESAWGVDDEERRTSYDWPQSMFTERGRIQRSANKRRRAAAALDALEPF